MSTFRTNDPTKFAEVDGIVIDETAPSPKIQGAGTGVAILAGQFERGLAGLVAITSTEKLYELCGNNLAFEGQVALLNKRFSSIKLSRVVASDAVLATKTFNETATPTIKFDAKQGLGAYGNGIKVTIEAGSSSGNKYTIQDTNDGAVNPDEVYDDIEIAAIVPATFALSKLVDVEVLDVGGDPDAAAATALADGDDGTVADTDYETAIAFAAQEGAGDILFLDEYNETRNGYLKIHAGATQDKICILSHENASDSVSTLETNLDSVRDADGRLIYAINWLETLVNGVATFVSPASFYASVMSVTSPHISPAYSGNTQHLFGVSDIYSKFNRANYIALMEAGGSAFEFDKDIGIKIRSAVVTQIANSSKLTVVRRRMADYLTNSIAVFMKVYQGAVNSLDNRLAVKGAMLSWIGRQENLGMLPTDAEVSSGDAKIVDITSLNTDEVIGLGKFFIVYKQRIYSSMRFIVLRAEIGETVVVTESDA